MLTSFSLWSFHNGKADQKPAKQNFACAEICTAVVVGPKLQPVCRSDGVDLLVLVFVSAPLVPGTSLNKLLVAEVCVWRWPVDYSLGYQA